MHKSFNKKRITNKSSKYNKHKHKYSGGFQKKVNYLGILTQLISNKFTYLNSVRALIKSKGDVSIVNKLLTNKTFYIVPEYIKYNNVLQQLIDMDFPVHIAFPALLTANWNISLLFAFLNCIIPGFNVPPKVVSFAVNPLPSI